MSYEQVVNDIIVLVASIILFISMIIWTCMVCIRVCRSKKKLTTLDTPTPNNTAHQLLTKSVLDKLEKDNTVNNRKVNKKKKKSKVSESVKSSVNESNHGILNSKEENTSEESYLLFKKSSSNANESSNSLHNKSHESITLRDNTIKVTFIRVLSAGMTLTIYTPKGPKLVNIVLNGDELSWKTAKLFAKKRSKVDLKTIIEIREGKKTENFKSAVSVSDDCCFSLIQLDDTSIDLQLSSKVERDIVLQGFHMIINDLKLGLV